MAENGHFGKFWGGGVLGLSLEKFSTTSGPYLGFTRISTSHIWTSSPPPPREVLQTLKQKPETQGPTFQNGTGVIYASLCHMFFLVSGLF